MKKKSRITCTRGLRCELVNLVVEHSYSIREASEAMRVSKGALKSGYHAYEKKPKGIIGKGAPLSPSSVKYAILKKLIKRKALKNGIFKKASDFLMSDYLENLR